MSEFRALRYTTKGLTKCDQCQRVAHHTYKIPFGDYIYNLCSGECVELSRQNFEKNKNIHFVDETERAPDMLTEDFD